MQNIFWTSEAEPVLQALDAGSSPVLASGLGAAARAHMAAAVRRALGAPLVCICPDDQSAETMQRDLEALLGEEALLLPSREFTFYSADSASRSAEQRRIAALDALAAGRANVAVCTVAALLQRAIPPEVLRRSAAEIPADASVPMDELEKRLVECGYTHRLQVDGAGQYSRRGGILDFFSPAHEQPVRIEFWDEDVDSMSLFDTESQRRTERLERARILPCAETLPTLCSGGGLALAALLDEAASKAARRKNGDKLVQTLRADAERLRERALLPDADRYMGLIYPDFACALDYIPQDAVIFLDQPSKSGKLAAEQSKQLAEDLRALAASGSLIPGTAYRMSWHEMAERLGDFPVVMGDNFVQGRLVPEPRAIVSVTAKQLPSYGGSLETAVEDVKHYTEHSFAVMLLAADERRQGLLCDFFAERGIECLESDRIGEGLVRGRCTVTVGALSGGMEYPRSELAVLTDAQLMRSAFRKPKRRKKASDRRALDSCADLAVGDLVVHEHHGIGRFAGVVKMKVDGAEKDYMKICYAGTDVLYVPATQLDLVSKYIGGGEDRPVKLSKMGGTDWTKAKSRAKAAAKEMAGELIKLYAERARLPGHAFAPDSAWQTEFENAFGYQETDDQLRCVAEIKKDMESSTPMDRLLCGDVGYGKTEVALRAVMKCVLDNMQAVILAPTTVLAQQHYQTAMQRFFGYPVRIELMSRYRTPAQIAKVKRELAAGTVDIVIGTHSLLQKDVKFKALGLLVIDEEQRFGVKHKERLKEMSRGVDVLTLSATPIPRTLNMAMSGLRDMSTIEEPPQDRLPVQTFVMEHDWDVVCDAIRREVQRGGQVYYLHNRVDNIDRTASKIKALLPEVTVGVGHGKMDKDTLSAVMESVTSGETQVLVCTTIIETGIDIPNVNTLIIEDADKLGLAQLHQIRGRVGRSSRRASAYLTYRRDKVLTEVAEKRLSAIREFAQFNAGFRIAMRDLEIRGAGNLLGAEQSGHMIDVGYDMYLKLLEEAVLEERGERPEVRAECSADLAVTANIPESYVPSAEQRMDLYRRIALIRSESDADDLTDELIDRFGDPPPSVNALVNVALLRGEATKAGVTDISQKQGSLRFTLAEFDMRKVSALCSRETYKSALRVEAGAKPCLSLKLKRGARPIETARAFISAWSAA